jgi:hypothetical protein
MGVTDGLCCLRQADRYWYLNGIQTRDLHLERVRPYVYWRLLASIGVSPVLGNAQFFVVHVFQRLRMSRVVVVKNVVRRAKNHGSVLKNANRHRQRVEFAWSAGVTGMVSVDDSQQGAAQDKTAFEGGPARVGSPPPALLLE